MSLKDHMCGDSIEKLYYYDSADYEDFVSTVALQDLIVENTSYPISIHFLHSNTPTMHSNTPTMHNNTPTSKAKKNNIIIIININVQTSVAEYSAHD